MNYYCPRCGTKYPDFSGICFECETWDDLMKRSGWDKPAEPKKEDK